MTELIDQHIHYLMSAEGHEYPDIQVGDEENPRTFFELTIASFNNEIVFSTLATGRDTHIWLGCDNSGKPNAGFQSCRSRGSGKRILDDF